MARKKTRYTDADIEEAAENGINYVAFKARINNRGWTAEEAKTIPKGMHRDTYYSEHPELLPIRVVDKAPPWHLYQFYTMFCKW